MLAETADLLPSPGFTGPPIGLNFFVNNYEAWGVALEDKGRGHAGSPFELIRTAIKDIELPCDPAQNKGYNTSRGNFEYEKLLKIWLNKDKFGRVNTLTLEDFLERPDIKYLLEDPMICKGINWFDKRRGGKRITMEQAIEANKNYDPNNKPPSSLPGAWEPDPVTPVSTPVSAAGSAVASAASAPRGAASESSKASAGPASKRARASCARTDRTCECIARELTRAGSRASRHR